MSQELNIGIILLAAGSSSRMGQNKLLFKNGRATLLENSLKSGINSKAKNVIVVLGSNKEENELITNQFQIKTALNINWGKGIGSSIKCGLRDLLNENSSLDAVIISVCDQPHLSSDIFDGLIETYKFIGKKIVAAAYANSIGVPVLYDKSLFGDLLKIPDEYGAKKYIIDKASEDIITTFPFPKGEVDIDTIEDLENILPDLKVRETDF